MKDVLPNDLKSKVLVSSKLSPEQFYEEIKDKFTFFTYKNDRMIELITLILKSKKQ